MATGAPTYVSPSEVALQTGSAEGTRSPLHDEIAKKFNVVAIPDRRGDSERVASEEQRELPSPLGQMTSWRSRRSISGHSTTSSRSLRSNMAGTPASRKNFRPDSPRPMSFRDLEASSEEGWSSGGEEIRGALAPYHCQICLEDQPAGAGFQLSACQHTFCRACLKAFVKSKVTDGQVDLKCFSCVEGGGQGESSAGKAISCGAKISPKDIKALIGSDRVMRRKYARFLFSRENKTARECPYCTHLQVGNPEIMEMRCRNCSTAFCYEHGGAHADKSCAEHTEATSDETRRSLALIGRMTKLCPGCQTPVEKLGGCNQMICYHCNASFCWICGAEVDRGTFPVHFQWWNVNGCPNQQLQEDAPEAGGGRQCHRLLSAIQIVIVGPFAFLLALVSSLMCACCLPAFNLPPRELFMGCISGWGNFIMMLPIMPFVLLGFLIMGIVYVVHLPFRFAFALRQKYRQGAQHGIDTGARDFSVVLRDLHENPELAASAGGDVESAAGALAGRTLPGATPTLSRKEVGSRRSGSGGRHSLMRSISGSTPSSSTGQSALSPFAAILGYETRSSQRERQAIAQQHLQQRRLRLPPSIGANQGPGNSGSDYGSSLNDSFSLGPTTGINSAGLPGAAFKSKSRFPPQPPVAPPRWNSGPSVGSGRNGVWNEGSLSSEEVKREGGYGIEAGDGVTSPRTEMSRAMSLGVREMMGYLLGASPLSAAGGSRTGGGSGSGSISHSERGNNVDDMRDFTRSKSQDTALPSQTDGASGDIA